MAEELTIDPQDYFDYLKSKKTKCNDEFLNDFYAIIMNELTKAMKTGQNNMIRKLAFTLDVVEKERELVKHGIDTFVLREDIEEYIKNVADKAVKIIELEQFPRSIPDEVVERFDELKKLNLFDNYYVVFTDYTDEVTKKVEAERQRKDPILFGTFEVSIKHVWNIHDRFYYIADWEDEYCDLTLAKMVDAMSKKKDILYKASLPVASEDEVKAYIHSLDEKNSQQYTLRPKRPRLVQYCVNICKAILGKN